MAIPSAHKSSAVKVADKAALNKIAPSRHSQAVADAPKKQKAMEKRSTKTAAGDTPNGRVTSAESEWRGQNDMHTLLEADAIRRDPARHRSAKKAAKKKYAALKSADMC